VIPSTLRPGQAGKPSGWVLALLVGIFLLSGCGPGPSGEPAEQKPAAEQPGAGLASAGPPAGLPLRQPIPDTDEPIAIAGGEIHQRAFDLTAGDFLRLAVWQEGIDLALTLWDGAGETVASQDGANGAHGLEEMAVQVPAAGSYRLEIAAGSPEAPPGHYRFRVLSQHSPTAYDLELLQLDRLLGEGERLLSEEKDPPGAILRFREALVLARRLGEPYREAGGLYGLHRAYGKQGEYLLSAAVGEEVAELYRGLGEPLLAATAWQRAGYHRNQLGQADRAVPDLEGACALYREIGALNRWVAARTYLGTAWRAQGRYQRAWELFSEALKEALRQGDTATEALVRMDSGDLLLDLQQPDAALESFTRAFQIYRDHYDRLDRSQRMGLARKSMALALARQGHLGEAEAAAVEALELLGPSSPVPGRLGGLLALGSIRRQKGDFKGAEEVYEEALALAREADLGQTEAVILLELGHVLALSGAGERALAHLDEAHALFVASGDLKNEASARARSAQALLGLGRYRQAWTKLEPALERVEELRAETSREDFRTGYYALRQDYYRIGLDILMARHREEGGDAGTGPAWEAFTLHERRLARELAEAVVAPDEASVVADPALLRRREDLENRLREAASRSWEKPEHGEERIRSLLGELEEVEGGLGTAARLAARSATREAATAAGAALPSLEVIRRDLLDPDTLLLVFALGDEHSYLWAFSREVSEVHTLGPRKRIEALVREFARLAVARSSVHRDQRARLGRQFARELLAPIRDRLSYRRLVLVPEGLLQAVPWAAVPEPSLGEGEHYLVEGHEIVLLPSVSLELLPGRGVVHREEGASLAAFGDPAYGGEAGEAGMELSGELSRAVDGLGTGSLVSLPHTREEVEGIAGLFDKGSVLLALGPEARRDLVLSGRLSRYGILHFATHGFSNPDYPELSGLALSTVDAAGRPVDGFVRAFEIARLDLPADLVVLSACETGIGRVVPGEGMLSLARSFLAAGSARVISTLWRVSDRRTAQLMRHFYEGYLRQGVPPGEALRQAQLAMLRDPKTAAPYYWAGFTFQGDWRRPE